MKRDPTEKGKETERLESSLGKLEKVVCNLNKLVIPSKTIKNESLHEVVRAATLLCSVDSVVISKKVLCFVC